VNNFNVGGTSNTTRGGVEIFLVASCCRNWDKPQLDGAVGPYADFAFTLHSMINVTKNTIC